MNDAYYAVLSRYPVFSEVQLWANAMDAGMSQRTLLAALYGSDEYLNPLFPPKEVNYVICLYSDILGRPSEVSERDAWVNALLRGNISRPGLAYAIFSSHEYHYRYVGDLYWAVLGRSPSPPGVTAWASAMDTGLTEETIISLFYGSFESSGRLSDRGYINYLYWNILGRPATPGSPSDAEVSLWLGLFIPARMTVAQGINSSHEAHCCYVRALYSVLLERDCTDAEMNAWANAMDVGLSERSVEAAFISCSEFSGDTSHFYYVQYIVYLYALGRVATFEEATPWASALTSYYWDLGGLSKYDVVYAVLSSHEAFYRLVGIDYEVILRRAATEGEKQAWATAMSAGLREEGLEAALFGSDEYISVLR